MISSSVEFFDHVEGVVPDWGENSRIKMGLMLMHYITLLRVSNGYVELERILSHSGKPFVQQIMRNEGRVCRFATELNLDIRAPGKEGQVPDWLEQIANECKIDVKASLARHKKIEGACHELYVLTTFVRAAWTVMQTVHEETLRALDRVYCGHCHPNYKPKSWMGSKSDESLRGFKASELPGARTPQAVTTGLDSALLSAPDARLGAARKVSQPSQSSGSSSFKSASRENSQALVSTPAHPNQSLPVVPYPTFAYSCSEKLVVIPGSVTAPAHVAYYSQSTTSYFHHNPMQQAVTSQSSLRI